MVFRNLIRWLGSSRRYLFLDGVPSQMVWRQSLGGSGERKTFGRSF